jgi:hypothetical protein
MKAHVQGTRRPNPEMPETAPAWFDNLMCKCWRQEAAARLSFPEILVMGPTSLQDPHLYGTTMCTLQSGLAFIIQKVTAGQRVSNSCCTRWGT